MNRALAILSVVVITGVAGTTLVLAQPQPLIVFIVRSVLGGFLGGMAHSAGEEFYRDATKPNTPPPNPQQRPPAPRDSLPTPAPSPPTVTVRPPVPPDGLRWEFKNLHYNVLGLQFYTQLPQGKRVWPAGGQAYLLPPNSQYALRLRCVPGERVCFGAWSEGKYWGTGYGMRYSCTNCCRMCGTDGGRANLR